MEPQNEEVQRGLCATMKRAAEEVIKITSELPAVQTRSCARPKHKDAPRARIGHAMGEQLALHVQLTKMESL